MIEWADEARTRQGLYRFLGAAMRPPEAERLGVLASAWTFLNDRDLDAYPFSPIWRRFGDELVAVDSVEELEVTYVRLFGVGMAGTPAMPTESYYRVPNRDGGVADFISVLQREYRSMGLKPVGTRETPDHISTELEAMSYLCGVEAEAWEEGHEPLAVDTLALQSKFLSGHLAVWIPVFADRVRKAEPGGFYSALIDLVHAFVVHETDVVRLVVKRRART
jgi:TorA maturation chaperone TorD